MMGELGQEREKRGRLGMYVVSGEGLVCWCSDVYIGQGTGIYAATDDTVYGDLV